MYGFGFEFLKVHEKCQEECWQKSLYKNCSNEQSWLMYCCQLLQLHVAIQVMLFTPAALTKKVVL